jgi:hypothetical protein
MRKEPGSVYDKWNSRACGSYQDFIDRGLLLTRKLNEPSVPLG